MVSYKRYSWQSFNFKMQWRNSKDRSNSKCAEIAAYYSKARFSSHVPVDYTFKKFVKKPHGSVPGYVIYTNNKTIFVDPSNNIVET